MEKYNLYQQEQINKLIRLIDIENTFQSEGQPLFRCSAQSTIGDLILYLKKQIGEQYNYYILLRNGQVFEGLEIVKIWSLLDNGKQQDIKYKKKLINQQPNKQDNEQRIQSNLVYQPQKYIQFEKQSHNSSRSSEKQYIDNQSQMKNNYNQQTKTSQNIHQISGDNTYFKSNQGGNQQIFSSFNNNVQQKQQGIQQQLNDSNNIAQRIQKLEFQVASLNKQISEQNQKPSVTFQEQSIQKLHKEIYEELQLLIEKKSFPAISYFNEINKNLNEFKGKVDQQLKQLFELAKLRETNKIVAQTQNLISSQSNTKIKQINLQVDQIVMDEFLQQEAQVLIKLSCNHQIEKQKLELILQNAITQQNDAKCQICQNKVSSLICRQIGILGEQYLQIQNERNQSQLFQVLEKIPSKIMKCLTKNCVFYCIFDPQFGNHQNFFCPSCLTYTVRTQKPSQIYSRKF